MQLSVLLAGIVQVLADGVMHRLAEALQELSVARHVLSVLLTQLSVGSVQMLSEPPQRLAGN